MVLVLGHRGAPLAAPENTIEAFVAAGRFGADGVELDVRRTADGALVVHHDGVVPGAGRISALEAGDLPEEIPVLEAALDACAGMVVNIEIKNSPAEVDHDPYEAAAVGVAELLARRGRRDRAIVSAFSLASIDAVKGVAPATRTGTADRRRPRSAVGARPRSRTRPRRPPRPAPRSDGQSSSTGPTPSASRCWPGRSTRPMRCSASPPQGSTPSSPTTSSAPSPCSAKESDVVTSPNGLSQNSHRRFSRFGAREPLPHRAVGMAARRAREGATGRCWE